MSHKVFPPSHSGAFNETMQDAHINAGHKDPRSNKHLAISFFSDIVLVKYQAGRELFHRFLRPCSVCKNR